MGHDWDLEGDTETKESVDDVENPAVEPFDVLDEVRSLESRKRGIVAENVINEYPGLISNKRRLRAAITGTGTIAENSEKQEYPGDVEEAEANILAEFASSDEFGMAHVNDSPPVTKTNMYDAVVDIASEAEGSTVRVAGSEHYELSVAEVMAGLSERGDVKASRFADQLANMYDLGLLGTRRPHSSTKVDLEQSRRYLDDPDADFSEEPGDPSQEIWVRSKYVDNLGDNNNDNRYLA